MVNKTKYVVLVLSSLCIFSCAYVGVPKEIKQGFTYCYTEKETTIKELINIEGYYIMGKHSPSSTYFMFYEDGTFLYEFFDVDEERRKAGSPSISLYFQEIINDSTGKVSSSFYNWFKWGLYKVEGDTIKAQYVNHPVPISPNWNAWEVWYKVIDQNTLIQIYSRPIHYMSESDWNNWEIYENQKEKIIIPSKFIPIDERPHPNSWLKNEKWFWCTNKK